VTGEPAAALSAALAPMSIASSTERSGRPLRPEPTASDAASDVRTAVPLPLPVAARFTTRTSPPSAIWRVFAPADVELGVGAMNVGEGDELKLAPEGSALGVALCEPVGVGDALAVRVGEGVGLAVGVTVAVVVADALTVELGLAVSVTVGVVLTLAPVGGGVDERLGEGEVVPLTLGVGVFEGVGLAETGTKTPLETQLWMSGFGSMRAA
jgi:hypothetical protein